MSPGSGVEVEVGRLILVSPESLQKYPSQLGHKALRNYWSLACGSVCVQLTLEWLGLCLAGILGMVEGCSGEPSRTRQAAIYSVVAG